MSRAHSCTTRDTRRTQGRQDSSPSLELYVFQYELWSHSLSEYARSDALHCRIASLKPRSQHAPHRPANTTRSPVKQMDVWRAMTERRTIRAYSAEPISRALIERVVSAALQAPSNFNRQPWRFVATDDPAVRLSVWRLLELAMQRVEAEDTDQQLTHFVDHARTWSRTLQVAPVLVFAFWRPAPERMARRAAAILGDSDVLHWSPDLLSLGMALQNLLLAAHAEGLGACMHSGPVPFLRGPLNLLFDLPPNLELAGVVSLGQAAERPPPTSRRELCRVLSWIGQAQPSRRESP